MACELIQRYEVYAGQSVLLMAQIPDIGSVGWLTVDNTDSVFIDLFDNTDDEMTPVDADGNEVAEGTHYLSPSKEDVMHAMSMDYWDIDSIGHNASFSAVMPIRCRVFQVRMTVVALDGNRYVRAWEFETQ